MDRNFPDTINDFNPNDLNDTVVMTFLVSIVVRIVERILNRNKIAKIEDILNLKIDPV